MRQWIYHHRFRWWLVAWSTPSHNLNQCWNTVDLTLRNKLQWNITTPGGQLDKRKFFFLAAFPTITQSCFLYLYMWCMFHICCVCNENIVCNSWENKLLSLLLTIHTSPFKIMHLKMPSAKCRSFCLGLNVLKAKSRISVKDCFLNKHVHELNTFTCQFSERKKKREKEHQFWRSCAAKTSLPVLKVAYLNSNLC